MTKAAPQGEQLLARAAVTYSRARRRALPCHCGESESAKPSLVGRDVALRTGSVNVGRKGEQWGRKRARDSAERWARAASPTILALRAAGLGGPVREGGGRCASSARFCDGGLSADSSRPVAGQRGVDGWVRRSHGRMGTALPTATSPAPAASLQGRVRGRGCRSGTGGRERIVIVIVLSVRRRLAGAGATASVANRNRGGVSRKRSSVFARMPDGKKILCFEWGLV